MIASRTYSGVVLSLPSHVDALVQSKYTQRSHATATIAAGIPSHITLSLSKLAIHAPCSDNFQLGLEWSLLHVRLPLPNKQDSIRQEQQCSI